MDDIKSWNITSIGDFIAEANQRNFQICMRTKTNGVQKC